MGQVRVVPARRSHQPACRSRGRSSGRHSVPDICFGQEEDIGRLHVRALSARTGAPWAERLLGSANVDDFFSCFYKKVSSRRRR